MSASLNEAGCGSFSFPIRLTSRGAGRGLGYVGVSASSSPSARPAHPPHRAQALSCAARLRGGRIGEGRWACAPDCGSGGWGLPPSGRLWVPALRVELLVWDEERGGSGGSGGSGSGQLADERWSVVPNLVIAPTRGGQSSSPERRADAPHDHRKRRPARRRAPRPRRDPVILLVDATPAGGVVAARCHPPHERVPSSIFQRRDGGESGGAAGAGRRATAPRSAYVGFAAVPNVGACQPGRVQRRS